MISKKRINSCCHLLGTGFSTEVWSKTRQWWMSPQSQGSWFQQATAQQAQLTATTEINEESVGKVDRKKKKEERNGKLYSNCVPNKPESASIADQKSKGIPSVLTKWEECRYLHRFYGNWHWGYLNSSGQCERCSTVTLEASYGKEEHSKLCPAIMIPKIMLGNS